MHPYPHRYQVNARAAEAGSVALESPGLDELASDAPVEFDGPGGLWSPETLLVAAVADCFVLSFRAVAHGSKLAWQTLAVEVQGTLDRPAGAAASFTRFATHARLTVPAGVDPERARRLLEKAENICLIANSLKAERHLTAEVAVD